MPDPVPLTPLGHVGALAAGEVSIVSIAEAPARAMVDLRAKADDVDAIATLEGVLGFALPRAPRTSTAPGGRAALWLSVDQWLVTAPLPERQSLVRRLGEAAAGQFAAVTDMSDARAVIRLSGDGAREVIMKGAAVDLTTPGYGAGAVRRVSFAGIAAMVHVVATGPDIIELYVFRSCADYAWDWLTTASRPVAALSLFGAQEPPGV